MLQKKNEGILFSAEIRVVGSYTDRLLKRIALFVISGSGFHKKFIKALISNLFHCSIF